MRKPRIATGTVLRIIAPTLVLGLVVLVGATPGTETAVPTETSAGVEAVAQLVALPTPVATAATPMTQQPHRTVFGTGGTVTLTLQRTDAQGANVNPNDLIEWEIVALVTPDNDGLALISVDLIQDETNPELIDLPLALRPTSMVDFDRPDGIANPDPSDPGGPGSAYGGTPIAGATGGLNLI